MAEVISLAIVDELRDHVHRAVQFLVDGQLIGLPLETGYGWATLAHSETGMTRLTQACPDGRLHLVARSFDDAIDFLPGLSPVGRKLLRRCVAGRVAFDIPLTFTAGGLFESLPVGNQQALASPTLRVQLTSREVVQQLFRYLPAPLVVGVPAQRVVSFEDLLSGHPDSPLIFDGSFESSQGPTVVSLSPHSVSSEQADMSDTKTTAHPGWKIELDGMVSQENLEQLANEVIVFVCTGNTCRSPMAEALFRDHLAKKLDCEPNELAARGYYVTSAGIATGFGAPASFESVELMHQRGLDLTAHESQPLTDQLLEHANAIYTMTRGHMNAILASRPDMADRVQMLARDGSDVPDPIGCGMSEYQRCQQAIENHIQDILSELET